MLLRELVDDRAQLLELGITAGDIFHGALSWSFAEDDEPLKTPARSWGVATMHARIMLCARDRDAAVRCRISTATTPQWQCS